MDYDVEREKQSQSELRKAFRDIFPLASEHDLPWAPCHIKGFLRDRIRREAEERVFHFHARVVHVLCEVSPPKTHVEDMARIVVEKAKEADRLKVQVDRLMEQIAELTED